MFPRALKHTVFKLPWDVMPVIMVDNRIFTHLFIDRTMRGKCIITIKSLFRAAHITEVNCGHEAIISRLLLAGGEKVLAFVRFAVLRQIRSFCMETKLGSCVE
jgi:hypothetical protein